MLSKHQALELLYVSSLEIIDEKIILDKLSKLDYLSVYKMKDGPLNNLDGSLLLFSRIAVCNNQYTEFIKYITTEFDTQAPEPTSSFRNDISPLMHNFLIKLDLSKSTISDVRDAIIINMTLLKFTKDYSGIVSYQRLWDGYSISDREFLLSCDVRNSSMEELYKELENKYYELKELDR